MIIGILTALILGILLFKLIKNLVKTIITLFLIMVILSVIIGGIIFIDTRNFVKGIRNEENIFLLNDNGFVSGFIMDNMNKTSSVSKSDLIKFNNYYKNGNYTGILEDKHMFFVFELSSLADKDNQNYVDFLKGIASDFEVEGDYDHIPNPKTIAFIALVLNNLKDNPLYLVNSYKSENITVYPEPISFKILKMTK